MNDKQLSAWFVSPEKYKEDDETKNRFRERAINAAQEYIREARAVPTTGVAEAFAIWPETISEGAPVQPLDAFEIK